MNEVSLFQEVAEVRIILKDGSYHSITTQDLEMFKNAYPAINIQQELMKMVAWCSCNPDKRKTKRGIRKFINAWLSRAKPEKKANETRSRSLTEQLNDTSWAY